MPVRTFGLYLGTSPNCGSLAKYRSEVKANNIRWAVNCKEKCQVNEGRSVLFIQVVIKNVGLPAKVNEWPLSTVCGLKQ